MKNALRSLILTVGLISSLNAFAVEGTHTGGGGGGTRSQGVYMSFYSAGIYVEPTPKTTQDIPSLGYALAFSNWMPFLSKERKMELVNGILPSPQHEYYRANESDFDTATLERIKQEFQKVTSISSDRIELYAITDKEKRQTFLLPSYYQLTNPKDQAAILFHEAYWLAHPKATYQEVVDCEMAFEAIMDQPTDSARVLDFLERFSGTADSIRYALTEDRRTGALHGLADSSMSILFTDLLGREFISQTDFYYRRCLNSDPNYCVSALNIYLGNLQVSFPQSLFLKALQSAVIPKSLGEPAKVWIRDVSALPGPPPGAAPLIPPREARISLIPSSQANTDYDFELSAGDRKFRVKFW